jgi:hypothetical protein
MTRELISFINVNVLLLIAYEQVCIPTIAKL